MTATIASCPAKSGTLSDLRRKWEARLGEWRALGIRLDGEKVASEVLADLQGLVAEDLVTLSEASRIGGYSADHLQRLVAQGTIQNRGARGRPRIRREDVPTKPGYGSAALPVCSRDDQLSARRRIVADAQAHKGA